MVTSASRGDKTAIASLYQRLLPQFRAFVSLQMGPVVRAKETPTDIAQSVFGEILQDLDRFDYQGEAAFRKWLFTRGMHKIMDRCRYHGAQKRDAGREVPPDPGGDEEDGQDAVLDCYMSVCTPSRVAIGHEDMERVEQAFEELPEEYRDVILKARIMGMSSEEIAADMGRSPSAVRALLHRAIGRLSGILSR